VNLKLDGPSIHRVHYYSNALVEKSRNKRRAFAVPVMNAGELPIFKPRIARSDTNTVCPVFVVADFWLLCDSLVSESSELRDLERQY